MYICCIPSADEVQCKEYVSKFIVSSFVSYRHVKVWKICLNLEIGAVVTGFSWEPSDNFFFEKVRKSIFFFSFSDNSGPVQVI